VGKVYSKEYQLVSTEVKFFKADKNDSLKFTNNLDICFKREMGELTEINV